MRPGQWLGRIFRGKKMSRNLIALETFPYPYGNTMPKGQRFTAESDGDAEMLILAGKAREDDGTSEKGAITDQEAKRRKYKTRDMTAQ